MMWIAISWLPPIKWILAILFDNSYILVLGRSDNAKEADSPDCHTGGNWLE